MPDNLYDPASKIRLSCRFTVAGVLTDPTTVTLKVKDPAGVVTTYTYSGGQITKDSTGNYHRDLTPSLAGRWYYRYIATGAVDATTEDSFRVRQVVIP
jgi:hypothetical protein